MSSTTLSDEQELEAQQLVARTRAVMDTELLQIARTLVGKETSELFGKTEFDVRNLVLRIGAKMYELYLAEKKTAMSDPASSAPTVSKRRSSKAIAAKPR